MVSVEHHVVLAASLNKFSYHHLTESISEQAVDLLDAFFQTMLPIVKSSGGQVIDLVGHQLIASFEITGDPVAICLRAVETGAKMQQVFTQLLPGWNDCGLEVEMGIGIHYGLVKIEQEDRDEHKVDLIKGDVVDLASCLAEQNKHMLVSESIFNAINSLPQSALPFSKLWVSDIGDGIVAYQIMPPSSRLPALEPVAEPCQILIAEDNADLSHIFEMVLRRAGYSVLVAKDGNEALQFLNDRLPDLLLLDVNLPGPSGLEIIRHIRQGQKSIRIIVLTANYQAGRTAEADMADLFLYKPISVANLVQAANRFVRIGE